jgi:hypothetical protein
MRADTEIDILNNYIDRLQADASPGAHGTWRDDGAKGQQVGLDVAMLQMAAHLNSMRPGANVPNKGFVTQLRSRVLAATNPGTDLAE